MAKTKTRHQFNSIMVSFWRHCFEAKPKVSTDKGAFLKTWSIHWLWFEFSLGWDNVDY